MGLSFSVPSNMKTPPSLRNIFKELQNDLGINRTNATIFSMLLSIPIILASLILSVFDLSNSSINEIHLEQSFFAAIVACITAFLSIHLMMSLIQKTNFNLFIIYRICLGFVLLVFYV